LANNNQSKVPGSEPVNDHPAGTVLPEDIPSPLFVNIENSRRFRALPVYASLLSLGKEGYQSLSSFYDL
jgi:hypothetical protein